VQTSELHALVTHSFESAWFQPKRLVSTLEPINAVISWFHNLLSSGSNLHRYETGAYSCPGGDWACIAKAGRLYKLNQVDPQLESAWFQPLNLSSDLK
jgi:hypothetical protein